MERLTTNRKLLIKSLQEMGVNDLLKSSLLGEVYWMISLDCNLRCKVCAWWGKKGPCRQKKFAKDYSSNLNSAELMRFAEEIVDFRPKRVTFSGGEPLLNKKWYQLAKFFKKNKIKTSLTTNGVFIYRDLEKLAEVIDEINLSLGGPPSILFKIRENDSQHFALIMKGLKKLTEFKIKNNGIPSLQILYTISNLSYKHMYELIEFMEDKNIAIDRYRFQHLMFIDRQTFRSQKLLFKNKFKIKTLDLWKGYVFEPFNLDFSYFKEEVTKLQKLSHVSFSPNLSPEELEPYYLFNRGALGYKKYCTAPWHQVDIMPNGDIYTCHDFFIGNLCQKDFNSIWNGSTSQKLRAYLSKKMLPGCKGCFYHYCERNR